MTKITGKTWNFIKFSASKNADKTILIPLRSLDNFPVTLLGSKLGPHLFLLQRKFKIV